MISSALGGGFRYFLFLTLREMIQFYQDVSDGLKPPTRDTTLSET